MPDCVATILPPEVDDGPEKSFDEKLVLEGKELKNPRPTGKKKSTEAAAAPTSPAAPAPAPAPTAKADDPWRKVTSEGQTFWYNDASGESAWDHP